MARSTLRNKNQRRTQALEQAKSYTFDNSKAKRKGLTLEQWQQAHAERIAHLTSIS